MTDQADFFSALQRCSAGERANLRRNCGKLLKDAQGQAVIVFYRCVPRNIPPWQDDYWFAAACFSWPGGTRMRPASLWRRPCAVEVDLRFYGAPPRWAAGQRWDADGFFLGKLSRIIRVCRSKGDRY